MSRRINRLPPAPISSRSNTAEFSISQRLTSNSDDANRQSAPSEAVDLSTTSSASESFTLPNMLNPEKLYQAYLSAQKEISTLKAEKQALEAKLADAQLRFVGKTKIRRGTANSVASLEDSDARIASIHAELQKEAKHYQLFASPFFNRSALSFPRPGFNSADPVRYANTANMNLGMTAKLYEFLPENLHPFMFASQVPGSAQVNSAFIKTFQDHFGTSRSNAIVLLRRDTASTIFGLKGEYFSKKAERDTIPEIRKLIGHSIGPDGVAKYARFPPVLYRDHDTTQIRGRFLSEALFRIARTVIFGKTSLFDPEFAVSRATSASLRPGVPASTTYGLIAWCAIMARYVLSKDERFDNGGIGGHTQINYQADFDFYKRYLIMATGENAELIEELFSTWDRGIFDLHNKKKGFNNADNSETIAFHDDSELEHDMRMLGLSERSIPPDAALAPIEDQNEAPDEDDIPSWYGSDDDPQISPLPVWAQLDDAHVPNTIREPQSTQSDPDPVGEHPSASTSLRPGPSTSPPPVPIPSEGPNEDLTLEASREAAMRGKRGRGRPRGRGSKKV